MLMTATNSGRVSVPRSCRNLIAAEANDLVTFEDDCASSHNLADALHRFDAMAGTLARLLLLLLSTVTLGGCEIVGDIFKAGVWVGVLLAVLILVVVGFVAGKLRR
jgi:hypothetical protein